jgi:molecular chaperone GrpE
MLRDIHRRFFSKMAKDNNSNETKDDLKDTNDTNNTLNQEQLDADNIKECEKTADCEEMEKLTNELDSKTKKCEEIMDALQRTAAEFDNYKKRTQKEKETIYSEAVCDVIAAFLPVMDSIERAIQSCSAEAGEQSIKEGVELVNKQMKDVMKKLGVEEIPGIGEEFDPENHNAVMHVEDESYGQNVVVEEFQKGYRLKNKVIRHSMVKVAN